MSIQSNDQSRHSSVSRKIEALPEDFAHDPHIIVLATHAAMLRSDFSSFAGWEIIVDEVPSMLDFEQKQTHLDQAFFDKHYLLTEIGNKWCAVTATQAGLNLTAASLRQCQSHSHLSVFHRRVLDASKPDARRFVLCNLPDWDGMADTKVQWCWASAFSLWELEAFDRVTLLGNRFRADISSVISQRMDLSPINWTELPTLKGERVFQPRAVHIHYFSDDRESSKCLFTSPEGQQMLREIGQNISQCMPHDQGIWSANDLDENDEQQAISPPRALEAGGMSASAYLLPRQAGTNDHKKKSYAAMIYAAKPCPNLVNLLGLLGIEPEAWKRSVEHETIMQFVTRTSIRDADSASPVHFWVFDRQQALYLKRSFDELGYLRTTVKMVEGGPAIPVKQKSGPKAKVRTPAEKTAFDEEKRARDAKRKKLARARDREREKASNEISRAA